MSDLPGETERRISGLSLGVVAFLALALLPLGIMAYVQARDYQREVLRRSELALLALTDQAVATETELIEKALGSAVALGAVLDTFVGDPEVCSAQMREVVATEPAFSAAGFIPEDGVVTCSSVGEVVDMRGSPAFETYRQDPRRIVTATGTGAITGRWVVLVNEPVLRDGDYAGSVAISIPHEIFASTLDEQETPPSRPLALYTFNTRGELLTSQQLAEGFEGRFPDGETLAQLAQGQARAFTRESAAGAPRVYAITPIVPNEVYALGTWEVPRQTLTGLPMYASGALFPIAMWIVTLLVAYYAVHRLVIVHLRELRRKMRTFGRTRRLPQALPERSAPEEFRDIDAEFMAMAGRILRDEAQLENSVREKNILLKEVHHRVKNNLQVLSSIMSMKRRTAKADETIDVLLRLQDRILTLAAIHRNLYQSEDVARVDAAKLVREVAALHGIEEGGRNSETRVELDLAPLTLLPAQAVPLSLFLADALSNAATHVRDAEDKRIAIRLVHAGEGEARIEIENTRGPGAPPRPRPGRGIGARLIAAFVDQLGGTLEVDTSGELYRLSARFPVQSSMLEALDY